MAKMWASVLIHADASDPFNQMTVVGLKVVSKDGKFNWGCKATIHRNEHDLGAMAQIERGIAALAKLLILNPPPPEVLEAIKDSPMAFGTAGEPWWDLTIPHTTALSDQQQQVL